MYKDMKEIRKTNQSCRQIQCGFKEIDEMIATVDKNEDWKISYSEFRVKKKKNIMISFWSHRLSETINIAMLL